jgi:hypothetical protein
VASRSVLTLAAATTAHAGAFVLLVTMHPAPPPPAPGPGSTQIDLDLSTPEPSPPDAPSSVSAASTSLSPPDQQARFGGLAAKIDPGSAFAERSLVPPLETSPPSPETASSAWTFSPFAASPIDMRAAVTPDMVGPPRPPDHAEQPPGASTTGGLSEGLSQHDLELGLGHGGAVLSAAEQAARSADAPIDGSATFEVVVHSDGTVVARVTRAQGPVSDWARVADAIGRTVDPRRMHLPAGRGWRVVVHVDAKVRLPDGRDVKSLHGPRAGVSESVLQHALEQKPGSGGWAEGPDGKTGVGDENTAPMGGEIGHGHAAQGNAGGAAAQGLAQRILPTPHVSVSGKVCSATIGITPAGLSLSGGCSPENIGGHGTRIVSGHIVSEGAL